MHCAYTSRRCLTLRGASQPVPLSDIDFKCKTALVGPHCHCHGRNARVFGGQEGGGPSETKPFDPPNPLISRLACQPFARADGNVYLVGAVGCGFSALRFLCGAHSALRFFCGVCSCTADTLFVHRSSATSSAVSLPRSHQRDSQLQILVRS
jgi:hypothetical protein